MKILSNNIAVIEGDTHISKWVEDSGTLRIAEAYLTPFRKYVPVGGVVFDVGACIGDHTATYADWVGPEGLVFACEANPFAFECLEHNTDKLPVACFNVAVSDEAGYAGIMLDKNAGASFVTQSEYTAEGYIEADTLDHLAAAYCYNLINFIKIDAEGFETRILRGAEKTIKFDRPVMLIEVNAGALIRAGSSANELLLLLSRYEYEVEITDERLTWGDEQYDVICLPLERPA